MSCSRRHFLSATVVSMLGTTLSPREAGSAGVKRPLPSFGFIAGIVGKELKADWKGTLRKLAGMGYREIEIGRPPAGASVPEFVDLCREINLKPIGGGSSMADLLKNTAQQIDQIKAIGGNYLVCYWPWLDSANPITADACQRAAENLNRLGTEISRAGLRFCFHNHDKEFQRVGDGTAFDLLMAKTDPKHVGVELDLFWVQKGGGDILRCLKQHPGRYEILHVKDMDKTPERSFACVGDGIIDFPAILGVALDQKIRHYIVERDGAPDGIECLKISADYLRRLEV